jgi:hypothetical protein
VGSFLLTQNNRRYLLDALQGGATHRVLHEVPYPVLAVPVE